jgi:hypothetical protein
MSVIWNCPSDVKQELVGWNPRKKVCFSGYSGSDKMWWRQVPVDQSLTGLKFRALQKKAEFFLSGRTSLDRWLVLQAATWEGRQHSTCY